MRSVNGPILAALLLILALGPLLVGCSGESGNSPKEEEGPAEVNTRTEPPPGDRTDVVAINTSEGERVEVQAEIADDNAERQRGLMERTELAEDAGMLFVFDREQPRSFWMRNTLIPLSIAYISADGRIVDIQDMEPLDDEPPSYASAEPAKYALEVNQGFFAERGVEVGDRVEIPEEYR